MLSGSLQESDGLIAPKNDLVCFTEYLGYINAPFHVEWYNYLQNKFSPLKIHPDREKRKLQLWPRGHAKTECTTINYLSWLIGNFPDIHANIVTKTASLAEELLTALMTRLETDENYIEIFGELKPKNPRKWTSKELIVERREISKSPTLKATGLMGPITGGRSDINILDDIIDEENVRTSLQLEKVLTWHDKILSPTLYPWGGEIVIGTRWHYADIYHSLMARYPYDLKQAIQPDKTALWPEYWSINKLEEKRGEIGDVFFNCQYQNDPTGMEGDLLKSEWLHSYDCEPERFIKYAGVDPALGEGDSQSIPTLNYDPITRIGYLEDVWAEKLSFPLFLKQLKILHALHRYSKIFIESNAFQKVLMYIQELSGLPIVPTNTATDKELRFIPMSSHFQAKRILVNPLLNSSSSEFWNEWVQFPRGQHDDALDSTEIVTRNVVGQNRGRIII